MRRFLTKNKKAKLTMSVPLWKVRRELARVFIKQLPTLLTRLLTKLFGWLYYDFFHSKKKLVTYGQSKLTSRICVFVIFPKADVEDQLSTIDYLGRNHFSTVVVANKALSSEQRLEILKKSSVVIERFNFGYDFGGYREGFLWVRENTSLTPEHVLFLNDSCWFPVKNDSSWIADAIRQDLDYCSPITSATIKKREVIGDFEEWWKQDKTSRNFHYCSFALLVSKRVFLDQSFYRFFKYFPLTNSKTRTVRRGEIGLTKWVLNSGFSHGEMFNIEKLLPEFKRMSKSELLLLFDELTLLDDINLNRRKLKLEQNIQKINDLELLGFILYAIARQGAAYSVPAYLVRTHNFPFLKKSLINYNPKNKEIIDPLRDPQNKAKDKVTG